MAQSVEIRLVLQRLLVGRPSALRISLLGQLFGSYRTWSVRVYLMTSSGWRAAVVSSRLFLHYLSLQIFVPKNHLSCIIRVFILLSYFIPSFMRSRFIPLTISSYP